MTNNPDTPLHTEPIVATLKSKLNWLRAAVLGANDGIVSVSALVVGVASASESTGFIFTAGIAGILAGAISMAAGEYVSVSTQRDTEKALLAKEQHELATDAKNEFLELVGLYEQKGLSRGTATQVARELTNHDALTAHADVELHIDPNSLTNPWHAALASASAFLAGSIIPLATIIIPPPESRIPITFIAVLVALVITGSLSAYAGEANKVRATLRVVLGGALAMAVTFGVGKLFSVTL